MKTNPLSKIVSLLAVALFAAGFTTTASAAGPMTYLPVKSEKAARALKTGTSIALACNKCQAISFSTVNNQKSFLTGLTCASCKQTFTPTKSSGGRAGSTGSFAYTDKSGHTAFLTSAH